MLANVADRKKEQQMMARTAAQKLRSLATDPGYRGWAFGFLVVALLAGLPIAVWLDIATNAIVKTIARETTATMTFTFSPRNRSNR